MYVAHIWRYPVKSMAGEELTAASVTEDGIAGDRLVQIVGPGRRIITSRTHPRFLLHRATLTHDGQPLVDGERWDWPSVSKAVEAIAPGARLVHDTSSDRFDVMPLLVATDGAIHDFGRDYRRLRPNLVIGGVDGLAERDWPGRFLAIGECLIVVDSLRMRCVMTTYDPDTAAQDAGVLRDIVRRYNGELALNCWVAHGGTIRAGDRVQLLDQAGTS